MNIIFLNRNELVDVLEMTEVIKGVKKAYIEKAGGNVAARRFSLWAQAANPPTFWEQRFL